MSIESLTVGEARALDAVYRLGTAKDAARVYGISHRTIEYQLANVIRKLGLRGYHSRARAVSVYREWRQERARTL